MPETPTVVLVLMDSGAASGPVKQLAAVVEPLRSAGYALHCVVFQRSGNTPITSDAYLRERGATVTVLRDSGPLDLSLLVRLNALIQQVRPAVIETHGYRPSVMIAALRSARAATAPWVGYFHGRTSESLMVRAYDKLDHLALRWADVVAVMSERQRHEKRSYRRADVRVVYNAVFQELTDDTQLEVAPSLRGVARPRVGVIGRLSPEKGVDVAIDAWTMMTAAGAPGTLILAGDGQERGRLEALVAARGLGDRVRFLGHVRRTDELYPELDLLLIPSRTEGLPNVFLEALRHGLPVVSTRVGALPDLVGDTAIAALVPIEDPPAMAGALRTVLATAPSPARSAAVNALLTSLSLQARVSAIVRTYDDARAVAASGRRP